MGCGTKCAKYLLFLFNFLIFLSGCAITGIAIWARLDNSFRSHLQSVYDSGAVQNPSFNIEQYYLFLYIIMGFGAFVMLTGFLGCCGAICESACLLGLYFGILLLLLIGELVVGIWFFVKRGDLKDRVSDFIQKDLVSKYNSVPEIQKSLDKMQTDLQCCGGVGCSDYVPGQKPQSCGQNCNGCGEAIFNSIGKNFAISAGVCIGIVAIEILAMIFAMILCCDVRDGGYY